MSLPTPSSSFPRRVTRTVSRIAGAAVVAVALAACASPTEPVAAEADIAAPKRNVVCVGKDANSQIILVQPINGECPAGFDLQPWW